ncbi:unnamed protein product [Adineta steineri]|nr:unnamed protein product [Adineta steineri]
MLSSDDFLTLLQSIQTNLLQIGGPILLVCGVIGCVINLIVFAQKNLRKSPCSIYLIAVNIGNLLNITLPILFFILAYGYDIDLTTHNLFMCRFYYYTTYLFDILSAFYLILASIDRVLVTSSNVRTRQKSTRRLAYICIGSGTLFWILFHCHTLFLTDIQEIAPGYFTCYYRAGAYVVFTGYYSFRSLLTDDYQINNLEKSFNEYFHLYCPQAFRRIVCDENSLLNGEIIECDHKKERKIFSSESRTNESVLNYLNDNYFVEDLG